MKSFFSREIHFGNALSQKEILFFTKNLSIMLKSGVTLAESLDIVSSQSNKKRYQETVMQVKKSVENGKSLYASLAPFLNLFGSLYLTIVKIGESSGTLDDSLLLLSQQLKQSFDFHKKVVAALIYPGIVLATALTIGVAISYFVLPQLTELFKSLEIETLPIATRILLALGDIMKRFGLFILIGSFVFAYGFWRFLHARAIIAHWHSFQLHLPVYGTLLANLQLSLLFRNMGIMLKSGVPLVTSLTALEEGTDNRIFKGYVRALKDETSRGKSIEETLRENNFRYIPLESTKALGVAEKTGKLDETTLYLATFYEEETTSMLETVGQIIEPVILLLVGIVVAFLALSIIAPIYQFTGSIRQ